MKATVEATVARLSELTQAVTALASKSGAVEVPAIALTTSLKAVVREVLAQSGKLDDRVAVIVKLCTVVEKCLLHGLRASTVDDTPLFSVLRNVWGEAAGGSPDADARSSSPAAARLHASFRCAVSAVNVKSKVGHCRAWIRLVLNDKALDVAVEALSKHDTLLSTYYGSEALLRSPDECSTMVSALAGLRAVEFSLAWDSPDMDPGLEPPSADSPPPPPPEPAPRRRSLSSSLSSMFSAAANAIDTAVQTASAAVDKARRRSKRPKLFKVPLSEVCREPLHCEYAGVEPGLATPNIVTQCVRFLYAYEHVPGLMLVKTQPGVVDKLQRAYEKDGTFPDAEAANDDAVVYAVSGLLQRFLAHLPEPVIPPAHFEVFVACAALPNSEDSPAKPAAAGAGSSGEGGDGVEVDTAPSRAGAGVDVGGVTSPRCRNYRLLIDELPAANKCMLLTVLPFLHQVCGLAADATAASPSTIAHAHALAAMVGPLFLAPAKGSDVDGVAVIPRAMMDLLYHAAYVTQDLLAEQARLKQLVDAKLETLRGLRTAVNTPYDPTSETHYRLLRQLWDGLVFEEPFSVESRLWLYAGFQRSNPSTDFRGVGLLGLQNLVYFAEHFTPQAVRLLKRLDAVHTSPQAATPAGVTGWYPFAVSALNISRLLVDATHLQPVDKPGEEAAPLDVARGVALHCPSFWSVARHGDAFNKVFSLCVLVLDTRYSTGTGLTVNDFYKVSAEVIEDVMKLLDTLPDPAVDVNALYSAWMVNRGFHAPRRDMGGVAPVSHGFGVDAGFNVTEAIPSPMATSLTPLPAPVKPPTPPPAPDRLVVDAPPPPMPPPPLSHPSDVLTGNQAGRLEGCLPPEHRGCKWQLVYSLSAHGASLETLLSKAHDTEVTMLVAQDTRGCVFGAYLAQPWHRHASYFGSGQSAVFSFHSTSPDDVSSFKSYKWSHANKYFQLVTEDSIAVGGGGNFALYLDGELFVGASGDCATFSSPCLASEENFECALLEVWTFVPNV